MILEIKKRINKELKKFVKSIDKQYRLSKISPLLFKNIKDFVLRDGKRIRPILFIVGYRGFSRKTAANLYTSALAIELLHDFMLVHDDIIDKSDTRRGKPSMHAMFDKYLSCVKNNKFNGQDLSIVAGDVMYAIAINAFLSIKENMLRKEKALKKFIEAAMHTGSGEFIELIYGIKDLKHITRENIIKVYDYKTAHYTFACPLATGAILGGADENEVNKLFQYGIYLGRAFQIKDDLISMFKDKKEIGKSPLADLKEAKKTLIIWYAYNHSDKKNQKIIRRVFSKDNVDKKDLIAIRRVIVESGALEYAKKEVSKLVKKSQDAIEASKIKLPYKTFLSNYTREILKI